MENGNGEDGTTTEPDSGEDKTDQAPPETKSEEPGAVTSPEGTDDTATETGPSDE